MKIQPRDQKILSLSYEHGFLEMKHVECFFTSPREARRRVFELRESGYLDRVEAPVVDSRSILRLTRQGIYAVESELPRRIHQRARIYPATFFHDSKVISVRLRLERLWRGRWTPEVLLRGRAAEVPDGIFTFPSGNQIYVELENSIKGRNRFLRRLRSFDVPILTLYITTHPDIENALKRFLGSDCDLPPAAVIGYQALLTGTPTAWSPTRPFSLFHKQEF